VPGYFTDQDSSNIVQVTIDTWRLVYELFLVEFLLLRVTRSAARSQLAASQPESRFIFTVWGLRKRARPNYMNGGLLPRSLTSLYKTHLGFFSSKNKTIYANVSFSWSRVLWDSKWLSEEHHLAASKYNLSSVDKLCEVSVWFSKTDCLTNQVYETNEHSLALVWAATRHRRLPPVTMVEMHNARPVIP
jgi:hypothetical protein